MRSQADRNCLQSIIMKIATKENSIYRKTMHRLLNMIA